MNFGSHVFSVPRYFDKLAESLDLDLSDVKAQRIDKSLELSYQCMRDSGYRCMEEMFARESEKSEREFKIKERTL